MVLATFVAVNAANNAPLTKGPRAVTITSTWASASYAKPSTTATLTYQLDKDGRFAIQSPESTTTAGGASTLTLVSVASPGMAYNAALSSVMTTYKWPSATPEKKGNSNSNKKAP